MAQRRRRHVRRTVLVFLTSLAIHVGLFFVAISEFQFYPRPQAIETPVPVEMAPEVIPPIPRIPPPPPPKPEVAPKPTPPSPPPQPQPLPQPQAQPTPAAQAAPAKPAPIKSAPIKTAVTPTPAPAPKPAPAPSPLAPPVPAPQPGPPKTVSVTNATQTQPHVVATHQLVLHKSQQPGSPIAPPVSIPGAIFAPPPQPGGQPPGGAAGGPGAPGGPSAAGAGLLPGGRLPGFGTGLRGTALGCMNAEALNLTTAEKQRCAEAYGMGTTSAPQMDHIDASKRAVIDKEAAQEAAADKYRDSTPAQSDVTPEAGQNHLGHAPGQ